MPVMTDTARSMQYGQEATAFKIYYENISIDQRANISLINRLGSALTDIPDGATIISFGITGSDAKILDKKFGPEMTLRGIHVVHVDATVDGFPFPDRTVSAVIGNVTGDETLPEYLQEIERVSIPEGSIFLNVHKGPSQNGDFDNPFVLDDQLEEAGLFVRGTSRRDRQTWWEVNAATMPELIPQLQSETREQPKVFEIGGDVFDHHSNSLGGDIYGY